MAEPHSSIGRVADLRTRGLWFDPLLGQYSFRGLMIVTTVRCFDNGNMGKQPEASKKYWAEYWLKELQESMDTVEKRR